MQGLHKCCYTTLAVCVMVTNDRGRSLLRLGCGRGLLTDLATLPTEQADMRVWNLLKTSSRK